ncbi:hypothetical protein AKJ57_03655 [candidate division MSBL1 archaeon SCGC-AAA259A05]|uniref:CAAX prenyl protease 2/Lysostaphin resistance protein A-like domain-containing protein n=1 Tax=candidate division MSBL1 archaeon SCGC-AAA259A05 TaxID=1698259 RepID=A0A133U9C6_9EURY|nr:hypothetical protein AKJ57_03655 [candidate division MSBL1 archaeon SCGC-AAA259A05]
MNLPTFLAENWMIIVPVVLFFLALILGESEGASESVVKTGGVSNSVLSKHLFSHFPNGFYTHFREGPMTLATWIYALSLLVFAWILTNLPEFQALALPYVILGIIAIVIAFAEILSAKKTFPSAFAGLSGYNVGPGVLILSGVAVACVFIPLSFTFQVSLEVEMFAVGGFLPTLAVVGFLIPTIEEGVFSSTVGASFCEKAGAIGGIVGITAIWVAFHYYAWGPFTISEILYLGGFRVVCMAFLVKYKSFLPAWISHMAINSFTVIA